MIDFDDGGVAQALRDRAQIAPAQIGGTVATWGQITEARVKLNASGRPGPNVISGDYRRSITTDTTIDATSAEATTGTDAAQAMRLEYGFTGTDSLGRTFNQPPYAHWRPVQVELEQDFPQAVRDALEGT